MQKPNSVNEIDQAPDIPHETPPYSIQGRFGTGFSIIDMCRESQL
jgi:hypothetical protein